MADSLVPADGVVLLALALPYLPWHGVFGFVPLSAPLLLGVVGLTLGYVVVVEVAKKQFYWRTTSVALADAG